MVNFIHYFGYLEFGYMEFPLIWDIFAGTNTFLVSGIICTKFCARPQWWLWDMCKLLHSPYSYWILRTVHPICPRSEDQSRRERGKHSYVLSLEMAKILRAHDWVAISRTLIVGVHALSNAPKWRPMGVVATLPRLWESRAGTRSLPWTWVGWFLDPPPLFSRPSYLEAP